MSVVLRFFACVAAPSEGDEAEPPSVEASEACEQYLACAAAVDPDGLDDLIAAYGTDGSCWQEEALDCEAACVAGTSDLRAGEPDDACFGPGERDCWILLHAGEVCTDPAQASLVGIVEHQGCADAAYDACRADAIVACDDDTLGNLAACNED